MSSTTFELVMRVICIMDIVVYLIMVRMAYDNNIPILHALIASAAGALAVYALCNGSH